MKRFLALILAAALALAPLNARAEEDSGEPPMEPAPTAAEPEATPIALELTLLPFEDVAEKDWFYDNVRACYEEKIMLGTDATVFSPHGILREEETATLAARLLARQRGETLPGAQDGEIWYAPVLRYLADLNLGITPGVQCTRGRFLVMLGAVLEEGALEPIRQVTSLPDSDSENVLRFYQAGILNGKDVYGTFQALGTLTRAEAAAMVSRILRSDLRSAEALADYSSFRAAGVTPATPFFSNGIVAEQYLNEVNELIASLEYVCDYNGIEFNWYNTCGKQTFLEYVTETALTELGVSQSMGTQAYSTFNVQVYYSRLIDLRGGLGLLGGAADSLPAQSGLDQ